MTMGAQLPVYKDASADIEARLIDLLGRMTPEEKARQLDQYFGTGFVDRTHPRMDTVVAEGAVVLWDKVRQDIGDLGVGCVHERQTVAFTLTAQDLQTLDRNLNWVVEPGPFQILIGSSSRDIRLTAALEVE